MSVKGDPGHTRRTQTERREATRGALIEAARTLFAAKGFAATGRAAGVAGGSTITKLVSTHACSLSQSPYTMLTSPE